MPSLKEIRNNKTLAYVLPFVVFMLFLSLDAVLSATGFKIENEYAGAWYRFYTEQWIYPLQSIVCFAVLLFFWKHYEFRPIKGWGLGAVVGVIGIVLWILPAVLYAPLGVKDWPSFELSVPLILDNKPIWSVLGLAERPDGFDATWFRDDHPVWYACAIFMRFFRMVVVVALVEEIFWRGFLLRYIIDMEKPFWTIAFGTYQARAFWIVVGLFMLAHAPEDWLGAIIFCALANWVAIRTKSLFACVLCHAVANLLLGIYVMATQQWGYW